MMKKFYVGFGVVAVVFFLLGGSLVHFLHKYEDLKAQNEWKDHVIAHQRAKLQAAAFEKAAQARKLAKKYPPLKLFMVWDGYWDTVSKMGVAFKRIPDNVHHLPYMCSALKNAKRRCLQHRRGMCDEKHGCLKMPCEAIPVDSCFLKIEQGQHILLSNH